MLVCENRPPQCSRTGEIPTTLLSYAKRRKNAMSWLLIYALSLVATFVAWYLFTVVPNRAARGILRATVIALLCSPGILVGHGIGVAPTLIALQLQPSIFTYVPMLIVWIIALGVIFGVPVFRSDRGEWPPSTRQIFLGFYPAKFILFGVVAAILMLSLSHAGDWRSPWVIVPRYGLFFAAAVVNLALCYWASRAKQAKPLVTPLYFSAPALLVTAPTVALMWYGSGAIGGLMGSGRQRIAAWVSLGVFGLLSANSMLRIYLAATAAPHVTIGGGVAGNAAMAALFAVLAIVPWWMLRRQAQADANTVTSQPDEAGV